MFWVTHGWMCNSYKILHQMASRHLVEMKKIQSGTARACGDTLPQAGKLAGTNFGLVIFRPGYILTHPTALLYI